MSLLNKMSRAAPALLALSSTAAVAGAGDHVKVAGGELIPSVSLTSTWRSNNYLTPGAAYDSADRFRTIPGFNLSISPSLKLKTRSRYLNVDALAVYEARKFFKEELQNLDRFNNVNLGLQTVILPEGFVGGKVGTSLRVTGRESEAVNSDDAYLQQTTSRTNAALTVRPGSSLEIDVGGTFDVRDVKTPQPLDGTDNYSLNSSQGYGFLGNLTWKFFPKTALVATVERSYFDWDNNTTVLYDRADGPVDPNRFPGVLPFVLEDGGQGLLYVPDGKLLRVEGGIRGRFTEKLIIGAVIGATRIIYDDKLDGSFAKEDRATGCDVPTRGTQATVGDDLIGLPCTLSGNLEVGYDISKDQRFVVGFLREHQDVFFTNYLTMNRTYATFTGKVGDRLKPVVGAEYNQQNYHGQVERTDGWIRAKGDLAVRTAPWLDVTTGVWYTGRRSVGAEFGEVEYDDVNVHAGLVFTY